MRRRVWRFMAACVCASAASAAPAGPGDVDARAPRVASLNLCTDEFVLLLAEPEQIVSVTHLAQDRHEFPWWRSARLYTANDGSVASVAADRPDIILTMGGTGRDQQRLARAIDAELVVIPFPQDLAAIEEAIGTVAARLEQPARGRRVLRQFGALMRTRPEVETEGVFLSGGGQSAAAGGIADQWLSLAGVDQPDDQGFRMTAEQLLRDPPGLVIRSDYRRNQTSRGNFWPGFRILRRLAVRQIATDGRRWTCAGPSLIPEIRRLRAALAG